MRSGPEQALKVWDPLVRVFHWCLVACVATAWVLAERWRSGHEWAGYAVLGLIGLRIVWGLVGGRYARFRQFLRPPAEVGAYARAVLAGHAPRHLGHNPLGGWMVAGLLLVLAAIGLSGWMLGLDAFFGDEWLEELHEALANGLLVMVVLHVAGALFTGWQHAENLVLAMVTGRKRKPQRGDVA